MSNCAQPDNSCDQRPIGSPPVASCSPCAEPPTPETQIALLNAALGKICELETRLNNWSTLLQRERNRTTVLEGLVKVKKAAPARVSLSTCGGEESDVVSALSGCSDGSAKTLTMAKCQVPMMTDDGVMGVELGPTWLPAKIQLRTGSFANTTYTYNITAHNPPECAKWAIVQAVMGVFSSSGGTTNSALYNILPNGVETQVLIAGAESSGYGSGAATLRVPIVNGEVKFRASVGSTHTTRSLSLNLVGFE